MDNTLDALRQLYVAIGGNAETVADLVIIPDLLNAIAALMANVTSYIEEGFTPYITEISESGGTYSADNSYEDISEAYENGRRLVLKMQIGEIIGYAELQGLMGTSYVFTADDFVNHLHYVVGINADDSVAVAAYVLTPAT